MSAISSAIGSIMGLKQWMKEQYLLVWERARNNKWTGSLLAEMKPPTMKHILS